MSKTNVHFIVLVWAIGVPLGLCIMFFCGFIGHAVANHWGGEIGMFAIGAPVAIMAIVVVARVIRRLLNRHQ